MMMSHTIRYSDEFVIHMNFRKFKLISYSNYKINIVCLWQVRFVVIIISVIGHTIKFLMEVGDSTYRTLSKY